MLVYIQLAEIAEHKQQRIGRDRFLVLAGAAACRAGYLEIAEQCSAIIKQNNPLHFLLRYQSFPVALRDDDFSHFLQQLEKNYNFERAEYMLSEASPNAEIGRAHV